MTGGWPNKSGMTETVRKDRGGGHNRARLDVMVGAGVDGNFGLLPVGRGEVVQKNVIFGRWYQAGLIPSHRCAKQKRYPQQGANIRNKEKAPTTKDRHPQQRTDNDKNTFRVPRQYMQESDGGVYFQGARGG